MGKSTAERVLRSSGFLVIDTDQIARDVVEPGQPALQEISLAFGPEMISQDGTLDRARLAQTVFADDNARKRLEEILHPRIRQSWLGQVENAREAGRDLAFVVIPLLFETGSERELDRTVCVACAPATQQRRLRDRGWSDAQIRQRIQAQAPIQEKVSRSDFVVWNEAGLDVLEAQLERIMQRVKTP